MHSKDDIPERSTVAGAVEGGGGGGPEATAGTEAARPGGPVLLFDGHCSMCHGWVRFVLGHERSTPPEDRIRFAPLESPVGRALLERHDLDDPGIDSVVFVEPGRVVATHSDAVIGVCRRLRAPWRWGAALRVVPRPLRDAGYRFVARHRHRFLPRLDACPTPSPEHRRRFLLD